MIFKIIPGRNSRNTTSGKQSLHFSSAGSLFSGWLCIGNLPFDHFFISLPNDAHYGFSKEGPEFETIENKQIVTIMEEISSKVKAIIVDKLGVDESEVTENANFTTDLCADSLDTVELIMDFEKAFDIQIPEDAAEKIATVKDAVDFITEAVNAK